MLDLSLPCGRKAGPSRGAALVHLPSACADSLTCRHHVGPAQFERQYIDLCHEGVIA